LQAAEVSTEIYEIFSRKLKNFSPERIKHERQFERSRPEPDELELEKCSSKNPKYQNFEKYLDEFIYFICYIYLFHREVYRIFKYLLFESQLENPNSTFNLSKKFIKNYKNLVLKQKYETSKNKFKILVNNLKLVILEICLSFLDFFETSVYSKIRLYLCTKKVILPIDQIMYGKNILKFSSRHEPLETIQKLLLQEKYQHQDLTNFGPNFDSILKLTSKFNKVSQKIFVRKLVIENGQKENILTSALAAGDSSFMSFEKSDFDSPTPGLSHGLSNRSLGTTNLYFTEKGNTNLWYLKIFAENNYLSHIKVNLIDDPSTNSKILANLLKKFKSAQ
jgi:hypothetical protein